MGPVRCHRFSRFFSLRFTARAYFPWENGAAAAGGDLSGVPCCIAGEIGICLAAEPFSAPLFFCDLERKKTL